MTRVQYKVIIKLADLVKPWVTGPVNTLLSKVAHGRRGGK